MSRDLVVNEILKILKDEFEILNVDLNDNLTEKYEFDSIDAIALLEHMEKIIGSELTQKEKKQTLEIRTVNHIVDFIEEMINKRQQPAAI